MGVPPRLKEAVAGGRQLIIFTADIGPVRPSSIIACSVGGPRVPSSAEDTPGDIVGQAILKITVPEAS